MTAPFKPMAVGAPRSGFALLASVLIHFVPLAPGKLDLRQRVLNALMRHLGDHISAAIVKSFAVRGITNDLLYNANFRYVAGGPKWLKEGDRELPLPWRLRLFLWFVARHAARVVPGPRRSTDTSRA